MRLIVRRSLGTASLRRRFTPTLDTYADKPSLLPAQRQEDTIRLGDFVSLGKPLGVPRMHESILCDFFKGDADAQTLANDLRGAIVSDGMVTRHPIVDMAGEFTVTAAHLVAVCNGVLDGTIPADDLRAIGFCLFASDAFEWDADTTDGERVAEVCNHWSSPEINFRLTMENVEKWKLYLESGVDQLRCRDA